jgi:hypothetical protein
LPSMVKGSETFSILRTVLNVWRQGSGCISRLQGEGSVFKST